MALSNPPFQMKNRFCFALWTLTTAALSAGSNLAAQARKYSLEPYVAMGFFASHLDLDPAPMLGGRGKLGYSGGALYLDAQIGTPERHPPEDCHPEFCGIPRGPITLVLWSVGLVGDFVAPAPEQPVGVEWGAGLGEARLTIPTDENTTTTGRAPALALSLAASYRISDRASLRVTGGNHFAVVGKDYFFTLTHYATIRGGVEIGF